jgi:endonuclease-3
VASRSSRSSVRASGKPLAARVLEHLRRHYPRPECALTHASPLELLVATILSAQCTDQRVNMVTPALFRKYRSAAEFAASRPGEIETLIRSTGFFNNKAKSIRGACARIAEQFGGKVPDRMEDLLTLPGVARKTANVVLGTAFGKDEGVVVDTHVRRLARRLGLTRHDAPEKIERDLQELFPRPAWTYLGHALIHHGRQVCHARKPDCLRCSMHDFCPSSEV